MEGSSGARLCCPECGQEVEGSGSRCCELVRLGETLRRGAQPRLPPHAGVRVLALDGGGTRGLLTIEMLKQLEATSGKRVHELFDVIGGTSTGGFIALALQEGFPLARIELLYRQLALDVFKPQPRHMQYSNLILTGAKHKASTLEAILRSLFSEASGEARTVNEQTAIGRDDLGEEELSLGVQANNEPSQSPPHSTPSPVPLRGWKALRDRTWPASGGNGAAGGVFSPTSTEVSASAGSNPRGPDSCMAGSSSNKDESAASPTSQGSMSPGRGGDGSPGLSSRPQSRVSAAAVAAANAFREARARSRAAKGLLPPPPALRGGAAEGASRGSGGGASEPAGASPVNANRPGPHVRERKHGGPMGAVAAASTAVAAATVEMAGAATGGGQISGTSAMGVAEAFRSGSETAGTGGIPAGAAGVSGGGGAAVTRGVQSHGLPRSTHVKRRSMLARRAEQELAFSTCGVSNGAKGSRSGAKPRDGDVGRDSSLRDDDDAAAALHPSNVFVVATDVSLHPPAVFLFRNYELPPCPAPFTTGTDATSGSAPDRPRHAGSSSYTAWEAGRATSAAPSFFPPAVLPNFSGSGGATSDTPKVFQDGALLANNPAALALAEARALYPGVPIACIASFGTGLFEPIPGRSVRPGRAYCSFAGTPRQCT